MSHNRHILLILQVLVLLVVLIAGPSPGMAEDRPVVTIGVIVAQSGKAREYGDAAIQGARLATVEINQNGGIAGRRLELMVVDNRSTALNARQAALKAVRHGVTAVVGAVWSTHSLAIAPVLQENRIPMISPGSTAPGVTRIGKYIFRACYTDEFQGKLMADFAYHAMEFRRAAILTNISETYSQILAQYFKDHFESIGGRIMFNAGYKGSASDFLDIITPLKAIQPEIIFLPGYTRDSGLIMRQAMAVGVNSIFLGGDAWETAIADYARGALEGSYFSTFWHPNVPYQRSRDFIDRFRKAYGEDDISAYAALAYDAVWLLADAIKRAGKPQPEAIQKALAATRNFEGATGSFSFNSHGDPVNKSASILHYTNGRWLFHKAFTPTKIGGGGAPSKNK